MLVFAIFSHSPVSPIQIRNLALGMNCMASFYCNIAFMLLISGRAFALEMPSINLPQGYSTSFRSVHNTLHLRAPTSPPKLPAKGAVATGVYRNMFVEYGLPKESVQARVNQVGVYSIAFVRHQGPRTWLHRPCLQGGNDTKSSPPPIHTRSLLFHNHAACQIFQQLFFGDPDSESVHFESADGSGSYVQDIGDNDVRSEGMS